MLIMSVEDKNIIDIVSTDLAGNAILTITDHLEWDEKNEHLIILQEKINSYLGAIETGELFTKYPNAEGKDIIIRVIALNEPNTDGYSFLDQVKSILNSAGYGFEFKHHS